jgi:hypothetical protein
MEAEEYVSLNILGRNGKFANGPYFVELLVAGGANVSPVTGVSKYSSPRPVSVAVPGLCPRRLEGPGSANRAVLPAAFDERRPREDA